MEGGQKMALHTLTPREVQTSAGDRNDGGGLLLRVTKAGAAWALRYTAPDGRRREMGLGPARRDTITQAGASLTDARKAAARAGRMLDEGIDPLDQRTADRDAAKAKADAAQATVKAEGDTLAKVARDYHRRIIAPQRTRKHSKQWLASLENGLPAALWDKPIADIKAPELLDALAKLRLLVPETARRVRQRLEVIFDDAMFHGLCAGNPALVVKRKLAERPEGKAKGHFAALPFAEVPAFVGALRQQAGTAARALAFALLTASRTGEVLGATWDEIDADAGIWRVPAARMKAGEDHVVCLSPAAVAIITAARELQGEPYVFPSPFNREKPLSNMAMLNLLKRMGVADETTVHGLCRSSFSTWANENGAARPDVIEACLAHQETDRVRRAYNRASFNAERRALLLAWAKFCDGEQPATEQQPTATVHQMPVPVAAAA